MATQLAAAAAAVASLLGSLQDRLLLLLVRALAAMMEQQQQVVVVGVLDQVALQQALLVLGGQLVLQVPPRPEGRSRLAPRSCLRTCSSIGAPRKACHSNLCVYINHDTFDDAGGIAARCVGALCLSSHIGAP